MSQKLLFIFNPHAGKGQIKNHLVDIVDMMVKAGFDVTIYTTQAQADATRKVVEEGAGYDRIVCSGGDGTLDEVMTGLMQAKLHIPIGYIPAGSTNDFANSLGIPKDAKGSGAGGWTKQISMRYRRFQFGYLCLCSSVWSVYRGFL